MSKHKEKKKEQIQEASQDPDLSGIIAPLPEGIAGVPKGDITHTTMVRIDPRFSGVARSVEAFDNQGFRNFRIVTLHIEMGAVVKTEYSDPYANFEAISRMELWNEIGILNLNNNWQSGKTMGK